MNSTSEIKISTPSSRYLVYTSAGDWANLSNWLGGKKDFDLWVTYYGNQGARYKEFANFYNIHQGSKWQNLLEVYRTWPQIMAQYEAILVMDDDIIIDASSIKRLFAIRDHYDLWVCQAGYDVRGIIRHQITGDRPEYFMRYVSFIENTCPLFRRDKLDQFMKVYDGSLFGNGVDYWYLDVLGAESKDKFAIIDAIRCINPHPRSKGGIREYAKIDNQPWKELSAQLGSKYGIKAHLLPYKEFGTLPNTSLTDQWASFNYRLMRKIRKWRNIQ